MKLLKIYDIVAETKVDETGDEQQPLEMTFSFVENGKEYEVSLDGTAYLTITSDPGDRDTSPSSTLDDIEILLENYNIYHRGFNVPIFNLDVTEDQLESILKGHCDDN